MAPKYQGEEREASSRTPAKEAAAGFADDGTVDSVGGGVASASLCRAAAVLLLLLRRQVWVAGASPLNGLVLLQYWALKHHWLLVESPCQVTKAHLGSLSHAAKQAPSAVLPWSRNVDCPPLHGD